MDIRFGGHCDLKTLQKVLRSLGSAERVCLWSCTLMSVFLQYTRSVCGPSLGSVLNVAISDGNKRKAYDNI